jgi:uncharacterized protein DUF4386
MRTTRQQARSAGRLYLLMIVLGLPGLILIPARLIVRGEAAATADSLRVGMTLFQLGLASEIVGMVLYVYLAFALYRLFERVDRTLAAEMVALVLLSVPIVLLAIVSELGTMILVQGPSFLAALPRPQLDALAYFFLRLHNQAVLVAEVFWGLWLVPLGRLIVRSGFVPKIFGILLQVAALGYLLRAAGSLFPLPGAIAKTGEILSLGEIPNIVWLLVWGATRASEPPEPAMSA